MKIIIARLTFERLNCAISRSTGGRICVAVDMGGKLPRWILLVYYQSVSMTCGWTLNCDIAECVDDISVVLFYDDGDDNTFVMFPCLCHVVTSRARVSCFCFAAPSDLWWGWGAVDGEQHIWSCGYINCVFHIGAVGGLHLFKCVQIQNNNNNNYLELYTFFFNYNLISRQWCDTKLILKILKYLYTIFLG